jgi:hypothetical protein
VLTIRSREWTTKGNKMNPLLVLKSSSAFSAMAPPNIIALRISAEIDSNRSAH